jgi:epoxyqueuosine reductase QueG
VSVRSLTRAEYLMLLFVCLLTCSHLANDHGMKLASGECASSQSDCLPRLNVGMHIPGRICWRCIYCCPHAIRYAEVESAMTTQPHGAAGEIEPLLTWVGLMVSYSCRMLLFMLYAFCNVTLS